MTSSGSQRVAHDDIAALAMLSDDAAPAPGLRRLSRETSRTSYSAPYSDVRMLSLIPPSTLT